MFIFGFGFLRIAQDIGNSQLLLQLFSDILKDCYRRHWIGRINDMSKNYKQVKSLLEMEKHLSVDFKFRKVLANFICSSHDLKIEKGRHNGIDIMYRFCSICLKRSVFVIEDKYHFVMVCPDYEQLRYEYFPQYMLTNVSFINFYNFLSDIDEQTIRALSKFLFFAFKMHRSIIDE